MKLNFPEELREFFRKKGKMGAAKRMQVLSPEQRREVARKAARARWDRERASALRELRDLLGMPTGRAVTKERTRLHVMDTEWLAVSPFCILATSDADGNCDASPKGDPAGHLVHVLDDTTVAIAERPGNRRADGYANILANPHVGIISIIPGRNETLRDQRAGPVAAGRAVLRRNDGPRLPAHPGPARRDRPDLHALPQGVHAVAALAAAVLAARGAPVARGPDQGGTGNPGDAGRARGLLRPGELLTTFLTPGAIGCGAIGCGAIGCGAIGCGA